MLKSLSYIGDFLILMLVFFKIDTKETLLTKKQTLIDFYRQSSYYTENNMFFFLIRS